MRVTVQYQETRKPYHWRNAFTARVLFADSQIILVRGCGSHSSFHSNGHFRSAGYNPNHPAAKNIPKRHGKWRLHPGSLTRLGLGKSKPIDRDVAALIKHRDASSDWWGDDLIFQVVSSLNDRRYIERLGVPEHKEAARKFQGMSAGEQFRVVRKVLNNGR